MESDHTMADTISADQAVATNVAIIKAFGFDPSQVRDFTIELDRIRGPIVTAAVYSFDDNGDVSARQHFEPGGDATVQVKRFKLAPMDD